MKFKHKLISTSVMLGTAALGVGANPHAQKQQFEESSPNASAPVHSPAIRQAQTEGTVARYIVGPTGEVRFAQLDNGTLIQLGPEQAQQLEQRVRVGDTIRVQGISTAANPKLILHGDVMAPDGTQISAAPGMAQGGGMERRMFPDETARARARAEREAQVAQLQPKGAAGTVVSVINDPRGNLRGFILADGNAVYIMAPLAKAVQQRGVTPGERVSVTGRGGSYAQGRSMVANDLTFSDGSHYSSGEFSQQRAPSAGE